CLIGSRAGALARRAHRKARRGDQRPQSEPDREEPEMQRITRRHALQLSGAAALAPWAAGHAPAYAQGTTLHCLKFVDFVPVSDQLLKGKLKEECQKALGITLNIETINGDGMQPRITAAIQAKNGPDILMAVSNWAQLYADSLADMSDLAEETGKAQGG